MKISESAEMYLETILVLSKKGDVHAIDIVRAMNFSRPTVSVAIHNLEKEKLLKISDEDHITLEPAGLEIAEKIYERHTVLTSFFIKLGVSENIAAEDACKIEHDISDETFECIKNHIL
ncbi:MAG: metal-dependent transcriptional regulator [Treponema sp.]|nr:metal-dependent transcriptional regulator [Treponema sp.]